jgi:hypothetical protein
METLRKISLRLSPALAYSRRTGGLVGSPEMTNETAVLELCLSPTPVFASRCFTAPQNANSPFRSVPFSRVGAGIRSSPHSAAEFSRRRAAILRAARLRAAKEERLSKNIYVGNLSFETSSEGLREVFGAYGRVNRAQVATERDTGRSRGFGFVEMADGGDEAIAALNGAEYQGRTLKVNEAKPREDRPRSFGGRAGR